MTHCLCGSDGDWVGTRYAPLPPDPRMTEVNPRAVGETRWSFDAVPQSARDARQAIREHAMSHGAAAEVQDAIALCVTEAVTNAVVHAYRDRPQPGQA